MKRKIPLVEIDDYTRKLTPYGERVLDAMRYLLVSYQDLEIFADMIEPVARDYLLR